MPTPMKRDRNPNLALQKAVSLLSHNGSGLETQRERYTKAFFEKVDLWKKVFELRSQGIGMTTVAKMLNLSRKTAYNFYHRYIELKSHVLEQQLSDGQMREITEYLERLETQREDLAFEIATLGATEGKVMSTEDQVIRLQPRKVLLDVEKQIAYVKRGLGLWNVMPSDYFRRKTASRLLNTVDEKKDRIKELLEKARAARTTRES